MQKAIDHMALGVKPTVVEKLLVNDATDKQPFSGTLGSTKSNI